ncbi:spermatogenesis-associated protein 22 [Varanus komodoensis]|uniref:spermatogenesis-associated protein 22 n=1 Tax=Varanus komodoensis TaxID=61221 RepID=UPI001CF7DEBB|nr:spermatogenesis-associated protein 22 [Varanus komodoensis]
MKRNFTDSSARSTAGCLPVPLFHQRKRNRQPLTSNPLENEPATDNLASKLDFSTMLADFGWETTRPEPTCLQKTDTTSQPSLLRHQNTPSESSMSCVGRNLNNWRLEEKNASANIWKTKDLLAFGNGRENRKISQPGKSAHCSTETGSTQQKIAGHPKASQSSKAWAAGQKYSTTTQWPAVADTVPRGLQDRGTSYAFKQAPCQQKANERKAGKIIQKGPVHQAKLQENDNSLRMICAVIESMKHWSQFTHKAPLLFEVLGTLDSAVTPGPYSAKTFLLRDGKETVSCVFYEIDWDLPRLIRGQVHRCVGNYDTKRKVFQCVSVRPATVTEQQTFQDFVKASDVEMSKYVKSSNET